MLDTQLKHKKNSLLTVLLIAALSVLFVGCEDDELNDLAKAQECFNNVSDSAANSAATTCYSQISSLTSPEAYALKCALRFREGGLTTSDIIGAFQTYNDASSSDKETVLINALALDSTAAASNAQSDCELSETPGLIYFSSIILLGTNIALIAGGTTNVDLDNCIANNASCATAEVGAALVAAESVYCEGDSTNETICVELRAAIDAGGSDNEAIAEAFLELLKQ